MARERGHSPAADPAPTPRAFRRVWWMPVLRGLVLVVLGLVLLLDPFQTLDAVPWILGGFLLVDGLLLALQGAVQRKQLGSVWWLVQAAVDVVFAATFVLWPSITPTAIYYVAVCWILVLGITAIVGAAFLGRNRDLAASWMLVLGVVSTVFGLTLLTQRLADSGLVFVCVVVSLYAVVMGAILVVSGFAVRSIAVELRDLRAQAEAAGVVVTGGSVLGAAADAPVVEQPRVAAAPDRKVTPEPTPVEEVRTTDAPGPARTTAPDGSSTGPLTDPTSGPTPDAGSTTEPGPAPSGSEPGRGPGA
ncbi:uncharacterized membrane protein HdeD (DUF308 family) [Sediminihabitans luteus]|uniref:Uncharacterized membrane protein HdeD (DUF308 family) n=1 Tax=Sediminihabitans luteus TaxID=1138585 RepID=A0A2M9D0Q8_9CELL|nr:DUF308 domain-containing protein [Sediminihabitans luteus]PJJ77776.1 uncharacterized membrane protein HdeD (DUF308 family) [Sediminihabitans luteus]GII99866.1 hypothetical protein Slu03_22440 [Sediminihabitans luteus]